MSKLYKLCISILLSVLIISCKKESSENPISNLAIIPANVMLSVGSKDTLKTIYNPLEATNKNLIWSSSDNSIVTVNESGIIVAIAPGEAKIKVTSSDKKIEANCEVIVTKWEKHLTGQSIISILNDKKGNIWCGSRNGIVYKYDGTKWSNYSFWSNSPYQPVFIYDIAIDNNNNIWFATSAGLSKYDGNVVTHYHDQNSGLVYHFLTAIAFDDQNNAWIGTMSDGVVKFDGTTWTNYNSSNSGLPFNTINTIVIDKSGKKWIGTNSGGLVVFDNTNWITYDPANSGLINQWVTAIFIDGQGNKWLGSSGGVSLFNGSNWTNYNAMTFVEDIIIDESGDKWVCSSGRGVYKYNGTTWTLFNTKNSGLSSNFVIAIEIDQHGNKWICTQDNGVSMLQD